MALRSSGRSAWARLLQRTQPPTCCFVRTCCCWTTGSFGRHPYQSKRRRAIFGVQMSNVEDTDGTREEIGMRKVILATAALAVASLGSAQMGFAKDKDK